MTAAALAKSHRFKSYRFERFEVDARSACLRCDGTVVPLRPKSFDVLLHLASHRGRLVSKDELFDKFDNLADQIDRDYDEYEIESETAGPVYQLVMRVAF